MNGKDSNHFFSRMAALIVLLLFMCVPCSSSAQELNTNWWETEMIIVTSYGFPPEGIDSKRRARALARRVALMDGYRKLAEQANAIHITAEKTVGSQIESGRIVKRKIEAVIKGAKVLSEEYDEYGNCVLVMAVPVYGVTNSIANLVLKSVPKTALPKPSADCEAEGNYTGLIIDCGDLDLNPVLLPIIRNENNQAIYSYNNLDHDSTVSRGIVSYVKSNSEPEKSLPLLFNKSAARRLLPYTALIESKILLLKSEKVENNLLRAGSNPLIIKASDMTDDNTCPVVSQSDSDKILTENLSTHFLDKGSVVFTSYKVGGLRA